jgi:hypothetical protein
MQQQWQQWRRLAAVACLCHCSSGWLLRERPLLLLWMAVHRRLLCRQQREL